MFEIWFYLSFWNYSGSRQSVGDERGFSMAPWEHSHNNNAQGGAPHPNCQDINPATHPPDKSWEFLSSNQLSLDMHVPRMLCIGEPTLAQWKRYSEAFTHVSQGAYSYYDNELSIRLLSLPLCDVTLARHHNICCNYCLTIEHCTCTPPRLMSKCF